MQKEIIANWKFLLTYYKEIAEKAMAQVADERLFWTFYNDSNSLAMLVQHISGNMLSRFTNFFEEDGEKPWRNRDREFEYVLTSRKQMLEEWQKGWDCFFNVLNNLKEEDLEKMVSIRNEKHTVLDAINRQLAHYSYHIGQIVYLSKMVAIEGWKSLSIPKNKSDDSNKKKFGGDNGYRNLLQ
ncbi:MAG: DUF1572 family protein [Crocinitomicaceae bacterium]|nr:DUF1572 family protein [Crocinitomicaceae bacterium]